MYYRCCTQIRNSDVTTSRERTALFFCEAKPLVRTQFIGIDEFAEKERRKYLRLAPLLVSSRTLSSTHLSFLHARHQICTPVLYPFFSVPRPPYHDPTSIDCSTALLPYFYGFTPLPFRSHPAAILLPTSRITAVDARAMRDVSLPYGERVAFAGAQEMQEAHCCQASCSVGRGGGRESPESWRRGPWGVEIRIADMRLAPNATVRFLC